MLVLADSKPLRRKPLKKIIEKGPFKEKPSKKDDDTDYLSSYYFKDIVSK